MRRTKVAGLTAVTMSAVAVIAGGFTSSQGFAGREAIKIVSTIPGPYHASVSASGAFRAKGYYLRRKASLVFPKGRLAVHRQVLNTTYSPPDLATCVFKAQQSGTFSVFYATGEYRGLRYSGNFWTNITGHLKPSGQDQCGTKLLSYRAVTYEVGSVP
jgi:hypothetical protein